MIEASEKTIAQKTPIKSCVDESAKCSGSNRRDPRSDFSASIPPSTTPSTINDISSLGPHFGSSEPKQPPSGKMRLQSHETRSDLATSLHAARYRDNADRAITTRQYARLVGKWIASIGLDPSLFGTHSLRRTKATLISRRTGNLRAVQLLLGHKKIESTVRYLGIEVDDALAIAEQIDV